GETAAEDGEILRKDVDEPAVHLAVPGDDSVAEDLPFLHAEIRAAMGLELVDLDEGARIEQRFDALASCELPGFVLLADAILAAANLGFPPPAAPPPPLFLLSSTPPPP